MHEALTQTVAWFAVAVAAFAALHTVRGVQFSNPLFFAVAALELALVALLLGSIARVVSTDHPMQGVLFFSYWAVTIVVAPAAVLWGIAEKSRWGTGVVVVGMLTIAALLVRLVQIWQGS